MKLNLKLTKIGNSGHANMLCLPAMHGHPARRCVSSFGRSELSNERSLPPLA